MESLKWVGNVIILIAAGIAITLALFFSAVVLTIASKIYDAYHKDKPD